jgi:dTDP-4-amino-4,6-dideoxygalactose transaminase
MEELYRHNIVGGNFRMDAIQAAALRVKLADMEDVTQQRRENAARYRELFEQAGIGDAVQLPREVADRHAYHQFVIRVDAQARDPMIQHLRGQGIGCAIYYPIPFHLQPCFADLGGKPGQFPVAEAASLETLALPIFQGLTEGEQIEVVGAIAQFVRSRTAATSGSSTT